MQVAGTAGASDVCVFAEVTALTLRQCPLSREMGIDKTVILDHQPARPYFFNLIYKRYSPVRKR